jgi:hypothetical protein
MQIDQIILIILIIYYFYMTYFRTRSTTKSALGKHIVCVCVCVIYS